MASATNSLKPTNPKDRAATSRLDISLFPQTAIIYGALGMVEGDAKYGGYNYRVGGVLSSVYVAATLRHLFKYFNGEWADSFTKVPHLASALACVAILIDAHECNVLKDDRPPISDVTKLLSSLEENVRHLHELFRNGPERFTQVVHGQEGVTNAAKHKPVKKALKRKKMSKVRAPRIDSIRTRKRTRKKGRK